MQDPSSQSTFYIYQSSGTWNKQFGERYTVFAPDGTQLAQGLGRQKGLALQLEVTTPDGPLLLKSQLRKTFPFSGKVDVRNPDETLLAIVTRSHKVLDTDEKELLALKDPTSWKENLAESFVDAIGNVLFSGGGDTPGVSSRSKYLLTHNQTPCGALTREQLPFFPEPPRDPGPFSKLARTLLPRKLSDQAPPYAWCLRYAPPPDLQIPEPIVLNSISMLAELLRWSK